jgi:hypothetical protein
MRAYKKLIGIKSLDDATGTENLSIIIARKIQAGARAPAHNASQNSLGASFGPMLLSKKMLRH